MQELRQRREDEKRRLAEALQIPKTVSDSITPAKPKTELVILGKEFALSELARIRAMSAKDYSHFISSLRVSDDTHGYTASEAEPRSKVIIPGKRKKKPRDDFPQFQEREDHSEISTSSSNSEKPYRTRHRRVGQETGDYYDESEVDILVDEQL